MKTFFLFFNCVTPIFQQELQHAFLNKQSEQMLPEGSKTTAAESCLLTLLEKKKPRLAQSLAHFLQVESNVLLLHMTKNTLKMYQYNYHILK